MIELIKELSDAFGPCGLEDRVAEIIYNKLLPYCDVIERSAVGSVTAVIKGQKSDAPILLSCGMDETTFMVNDIDGEGFIKLKSLTNHDPRGLCGRYVTVGNEERVIKGVMSSKVLHLASGNERSKPSLDKMFVDIGKNTGDLTKELIEKGDFVTYAPSFSEFGKDKIKGKALDSRVCCAILINAAMKIKSSVDLPQQDVIFAFNAKEKAGKSTLYSVINKYQPNTAIILSGYSVTEFSEKGSDSCKLGEGVVLPTHDYSALYFGSPMYTALIEYANKNNIKIQIPSSISISSSSANAERVGKGVSLINVALPCLNIRTCNEIMSKEDISELDTVVNMYIYNHISG